MPSTLKTHPKCFLSDDTRPREHKDVHKSEVHACGSERVGGCAQDGRGALVSVQARKCLAHSKPILNAFE